MSNPSRVRAVWSPLLLLLAAPGCDEEAVPAVLSLHTPDPLRALARMDQSLDSLGTGANLDSLPVWGLSASVKALNYPGGLETIDALSLVLADTVDVVLEPEGPVGEGAEKAEGCRPPAVLYVSGINTTLEAYRMSKGLLRSTLRRAGVAWPVYGAYNVYAVDAERSLFGGRICPIFQYSPFGGFGAWTCMNVGGPVVDLSEATGQELQQWANFDQFRSRDVDRVARTILRHLRGRRGLVIVAHSQGNLMVNRAVDRLLDTGQLTTDAKLRLLRLGSPIEEGSINIRRRFDVCGDVVSGLAGYGFQDCLPRPPHCGWWSRFTLCPHSFLTSYMHGGNRGAAVSAIVELGQQLLDRNTIEGVRRSQLQLTREGRLLGDDPPPARHLQAQLHSRFQRKSVQIIATVLGLLVAGPRKWQPIDRDGRILRCAVAIDDVDYGLREHHVRDHTQHNKVGSAQIRTCGAAVGPRCP